MSYQVLARKWRPRSFKELVGQMHVLKALVNALDHDRLHHAYLFTGTRGVGKTTIARIFAKCLNCEVGVSSTPCGECTACLEINDGRFVDLIEVDAASRTKVEDTRELLDNVQYAPTAGRFKVYLIDEVHMLSTHSFNALLKTLEEPPSHVKFLLATTDPQKLPVTILSRCLQFSLKNMTPEAIAKYLEFVLEQEQLGFESAALWQLARAADGSMRDALSLTDQAIAFGNGRVTEADVSAMLGTIDQGQVMKIASELATGNAGNVLAAVADMADFSPDYLSVFNDLLSVLHRVAIAQTVPDAVDNSQGDRDQVVTLANSITAEDVQLYYQIGLIGKKDLPLAPDPRSGFEMALLRMLAFRPDPAPVSEQKLKIDGGDINDVSAVTINGQERMDSLAEDGSNSLTTTDLEGKSAGGDVVCEIKGLIRSSPGEQATPERDVVESVHSHMQLGDHQSFPVGPGSVKDRQIHEGVALFEPAISDGSTEKVCHDSSEPLLSSTDETVPVLSSEGVLPEEHQGFTDSRVSFKGAQALSKSDEVVTEGYSEVEKGAEKLMSGLSNQSSSRTTLEELDQGTWISVYRSLPLGGVTGTIGSHCEFIGREKGQIQLRLNEKTKTLYNDSIREKIERALNDYFQQSISLNVQIGPISSETPSSWRERKIAERLKEARESIYSDAKVKELIQVFSALVLEESIQPVGRIIK